MQGGFLVDDATARELVVTAADRLFYGRGIQAVGMDAIRGEAGISLKRMYTLFPSKEAILAEVLRRRNESWTAGVLARAEAERSPRDKVLSVYDFLADWFAEDDFRGCAFINSFGELGATAPLVADAARAHKSGFQQYLSGLVRDAGAPPSLAPQLALLAEGAQTTAAISGSVDAATDARAAAATLLDAALGTNA
jgi:AcrR family transcriptional regulator